MKSLKSTNTKRAISAALALQLLLSSCSGLSSSLSDWFKHMGFSAETVQPMNIQLACETSEKSSCDKSNLQDAFQVVLEHATGNPGSEITVWKLASSYAATEVVYQIRIPELATDREQQQYANQHLKNFKESITNVFSFRPPLSPIAEGIEKIGLYIEGQDMPSDTVHMIVLISDLQERSALGDLECIHRTAGMEMIQNLKKHHVLEAGRLQGVHMFLTHFTLIHGKNQSQTRCTTSSKTELAVKHTWTSILKKSGAKQVRFLKQGIQARQLQQMTQWEERGQ